MTDQAQELLPSEEDRKIMGTPEAAKADLIDKTRRWRELRQPSMDTPAGHRQTEAKERETRFQLANAALLWLWHEENTRPPSERPVAQVREALEPFAKIADHIDDLANRYGGNYTDAMTATTTIGNCRAARAALAAERPSEPGRETMTSVPGEQTGSKAR
jgi:hypothetical protein